MLSSRPAPISSAISSRLEPGFADTESNPQSNLDSPLHWVAFGAIALLLLVCPFQLSGFWPAPPYDLWPQSIFLLAGAATALILAICPGSMPRFDATARLILAFLGWNALSVITGVYRHDSYLEIARVFGVAMTFFALRAVWKPNRALALILSWCAGLSWLGVSAFLEYRVSGNTRQFGGYSNNNLFANALAMALPLALVLPVLAWRSVRNRSLAALCLVPFGCCGIGLLFTSSRGGFLAALVGVGVTLGSVLVARRAQIGPIWKRHRAAISAGTLLFALLLGAGAAKTILPRLQAARAAPDNSAIFRTYVWRSTLDMALAKPVTGFGTGDFQHVYPRFSRVSFTRHAHQMWGQLAAEGGFPAPIFLLGATLFAFRSGAKRLKTRDWPVAAGAGGAIAAMLTHGLFDSGFFTTSVTIFFFAALALLSVDETRSASSSESRLNPFWLGATLLLALGGSQSSKAVSGQSASLMAQQFAANGAPSVAAQKATDAASLDPGSARLWLDMGKKQEDAGGDGRAAFERASQLQPTVAANWANLARAAERHGAAPSQIEAFYDRAVECGPLDTQYLLERGAWRLASKNSAGFADLERILALWNAPYGLYPPIEQIVELDFARATILMAPQLQKTGQKARRQSLVKHALADCARAQSYVAQNAQMAVGAQSQDRNADLPLLTAQLQQLQTSR